MTCHSMLTCDDMMTRRGMAVCFVGCGLVVDLAGRLAGGRRGGCVWLCRCASCGRGPLLRGARLPGACFLVPPTASRSPADRGPASRGRAPGPLLPRPCFPPPLVSGPPVPQPCWPGSRLTGGLDRVALHPRGQRMRDRQSPGEQDRILGPPRPPPPRPPAPVAPRGPPSARPPVRPPAEPPPPFSRGDAGRGDRAPAPRTCPP